jgi:hypothetical protein
VGAGQARGCKRPPCSRVVNNRELGSLLQLPFILILSAALLLAIAALYISGIAFDWYGELENNGQIEARSISAEIRAQQDRIQIEAAKELGIAGPSQILFGDLHVHTTFSSDAFRMSLPMVQGDWNSPDNQTHRRLKMRLVQTPRSRNNTCDQVGREDICFLDVGGSNLR